MIERESLKRQESESEEFQLREIFEDEDITILAKKDRYINILQHLEANEEIFCSRGV